MAWLKRNWLLILAHFGALLPLTRLIWNFFHDQLTANPIQYITFQTGKSALVLLILALACTPLNTVFGFRQVVGLRKSLGLYCFLYATLHFFTFVGLDYGFDPSLLKEAIFKKRYALVGFAAFLALFPLAITSTRGWMRRLGRNWKRLHRLIYLAALLAVIHFVWLVKSDVREPLAYGAVVVILLALRFKKLRKALVSLRERVASRRRSYDRVAVPDDLR
jgi:methionine sulfoxide reductase heme-binding subunit